jgi:hypothetical protein
VVTKEQLRAVVGIVATISAPVLTGLILFGGLPRGAYEAAIMLATLAWNHAGTVIRSLFPGPEIDVPPKEQKP